MSYFIEETTTDVLLRLQIYFSGVLRGKKVCKTVSSLVVFVLFEF